MGERWGRVRDELLERLRPTPWLLLALDGLIASASFWVAMALRFEGRITATYLERMPEMLALLVVCRVVASALFRLHRWSFRFSGLADGARVPMASLFGTGLFLGALFLARHAGPPRSVVVMELLLSTLLMATARFSPRLADLYVSDWRRSRQDGAVRTVIVGAGAAGELLLRDLQRSTEHAYRIVGFVDDDRDKRGHVVGGRAVLGGVNDLARIARRHRIEQVLIAIPRLHGRRIREILSVCADSKLRFKILPVSFAHIRRRSATSMIQDLSPEDLLPRDEISFGEDSLPLDLPERLALVTGASGSIGSEICRQLLRAGLRHLVLVDLDENGLYLLGRAMRRRYPSATLHLEVADVRDEARIRSLFEFYRPLDVFHAAAHKHVPLMETSPSEAIKNNVLGTRNVARSADVCRTERFVYISTDKAVRPTSVMGASKRVGEKVVRALARRSATRFCAVRFGNVLGSAGSVVPIFREQIAAGGPVEVTHPDVRRYFMTIGEAVALVLQAAYGDYGELCVLDMGEQIRIVDLARHMVTMAGLVPDQDIPIVFTGLRPGEKIAEELLTESEERTRRVRSKIFAVDCPAPPPDLDRRLDELEEAAALMLEARVVELLRRTVPSYAPARHAPNEGPRVVDPADGRARGAGPRRPPSAELS